MEKIWNLLWKNEVFGNFWVESGEVLWELRGGMRENAFVEVVSLWIASAFCKASQ